MVVQDCEHEGLYYGLRKICGPHRMERHCN